MTLKDFSPIKLQKVSQQIIDVIRNSILSNAFAEGEKLPNERNLMDNFKVSRQTIREALCGLETMGLIKLRPGLGGGAFVTGVDVKVARNGLHNFLFGKDFTIHNIAEVRLALEPSAAMLAASSMSTADKEALAGILDDCRQAIEREDDPARLRRLETAFHASIVRATGNPIWVLLHDFVEHLLWDVKTQLKTRSEFSSRVLLMHEDILEAITSGDASAAGELMRQDITQVAQYLMNIAENQGRLYFQKS